jgi:signal transduction histidine kinase
MRSNAHWTRLAALLAGVLTAAMGLVLLAAWLLLERSGGGTPPGMPLRLHPALSPVQPGTAVGILLCGAALALVAGGQRWGQALGALAVILGLLRLLGPLAGADLDFARLAGGPSAAAMAPNAALGIALVGLAILTQGSRPCASHFLLFFTPAACGGALGAAALIGYLTSVEPLFQWGSSTPLSVQGGLALVLLSPALIAFDLLAGGAERRIENARWSPAVAGLGLVATSWLLWQGLGTIGESQIRLHTQREARNVAATLRSRVGARTYVLKHIAERWQALGIGSLEELALEGLQKVKDLAGIRAVAWADGSLRLQWVEPQTGNEKLIGLDLSTEERAVEIVRRGSPTQVTRSFRLPDGESACMSFAPVLRQGQLEGYIAGIYSLEKLLREVLPESVAGGYSLAILDGEEEVYLRGENGEDRGGGIYELRERITGPWSVRIWPRPETLARQSSLAAETVLGSGHLLAILLVLNFHLAQKARRRADAARLANVELQKEIREREQAEVRLRAAQGELEDRVHQRTLELSATNEELRKEILERRRIEEEREQLVRQLEAEKHRLAEADQHKDEFLAVLSHELRNPLAPVLNAVEILRSPAAGEENRRQAREIVRTQVSKIVRLIDDLLDVARIGRGKITLRREAVNVADLLARAAETVESMVAARGLLLSMVPPETPCWLEGDPVRLEQIITNLLNNAVKYSDPGGRIWLSAEAQGSEVQIRVRDTGIGLAPETLSKIFEPFAQVKQPPDRDQGGLGIGLALAKKLVEMHEGSVAVESAGLGQGCEFVVRLPRLEKPPAREAPKPSGAAAAPAASQQRRVFVVDDNQDVAETLALLLGIWGHEVRIARDGEEALVTIPPFAPDVVLLDIGLPKLDGYTVARRLRDAGLESTILVALTGYGQEADRQRARDAGFNCHLVKPVEPTRLQHLLAELA